MTLGPEDNLQIATAQWNKLQLQPYVIAHHSANENRGRGKLGEKAGALAKRKGQMAGWWDWCFIWPNNGPHPEPFVAFIELKIGRNPLTDGQIKFRALMDLARVPYEVAHNLDGYIAAVKRLGVPCKYARSTGI